MEKLTFAPTNETGNTFLQGYLVTTFKSLLDAFGKSDGGDDDKTDAEWDLKFSDGTVITIYNYKDGKNYLGEDGMEVEDMTDWHIGSGGKVSKEIIELLEKETGGVYSSLTERFEKIGL